MTRSRLRLGEYSASKQRPLPAPVGFTLIELLVVIGIITMLASLLLPSLVRARTLARRTSCLANLQAIGVAGGLYQADFGDYLPICWKNIDPSLPGVVNPWKSWRSSLLPYLSDFAAFNCPASHDIGVKAEIFHCREDVTSLNNCGTTNAGSYGVIQQYALPSFQTPNYLGDMKIGHPTWSMAYSTQPGVAWQDPPNSIYVADGYFSCSPIAYPSDGGINGYGTSAIDLPNSALDSSSKRFYESLGPAPGPRRFADRHVGTNCLFVGGQVLNYPTQTLDTMSQGSAECVWDTQ